MEPKLEDSITDEKVQRYFRPGINMFNVRIPSDYDHDKQVDQFHEKKKKDSGILHYNDGITSENFSKASIKLEPGKTYGVEIVPIQSGPLTYECEAYMKKRGAIFVGAQGLTLVQDLKPELLPVGITVSLDKYEALWESDSTAWFPLIESRLQKKWVFELGNWGGYLEAGSYLLCFFEIKN